MLYNAFLITFINIQELKNSTIMLNKSEITSPILILTSNID